jgi:ATP-dependent Zn protease
MVNEEALLAARRNKNRIFMEEMEESIERVIAGPKRKPGSSQIKRSGWLLIMKPDMRW